MWTEMNSDPLQAHLSRLTHSLAQMCTECNSWNQYKQLCRYIKTVSCQVGSVVHKVACVQWTGYSPNNKTTPIKLWYYTSTQHLLTFCISLLKRPDSILYNQWLPGVLFLYYSTLYKKETQQLSPTVVTVKYLHVQSVPCHHQSACDSHRVYECNTVYWHWDMLHQNIPLFIIWFVFILCQLCRLRWNLFINIGYTLRMNLI